MRTLFFSLSLFMVLKSNKKKKKTWWGIYQVNDWISRQLLLKHLGGHHVSWVEPHTGQRLGVCFGVFFLKAAGKDIFKYDRYQFCLNSCTHELSGLALATNYFTITRWQRLCLGLSVASFLYKKRDFTITSSALFRAKDFVISRLRVF